MFYILLYSVYFYMHLFYLMNCGIIKLYFIEQLRHYFIYLQFEKFLIRE